ncbi:MAG TPA: hypothetical protein GX692_00020 [Acholeplasmataceae bacterium]|nr:hypothetical protein [Acholeplasmataceae bacterium]
MLFSLLLLFSGCAGNKLKTVADELIVEFSTETITESLELPEAIDGVKISWLSNNPSVLSNEGILARQEEDVEVELYASLTFKGKRHSLTFTFLVPRAEKKPIDEEKPGNGGTPGNGDKPDIDLPAYYDGFEGLIGESLKAFLHDLIDDHNKQSYDSAKQHLLKSDEDSNNPNNFILFYSGLSISKSVLISANVWDREHVWAKSHGGFSNNSIPGSDLHNLKPSNKTANNRRGNLDFDEGGTRLEITYGPGSTFNYVDSNSFEPRDEDKGDVARIIFYMAVRYEGDKSGEPDLELNDRVNNGKNPYMGRVSVLLKWNREDPVDDFEKNRNEVIYSIQGNRNPFIDNPDFAEMIWG